MRERRALNPLLTTELLAALDASPVDARDAHQRKLHRLSRVCGCGEGAIGALTLAALVMWRFLHTFAGWSPGGVASLVGQLFVAFLIGGLSGKFLGLAIARARLRALRSRILREAAQPRN